MKEPQKTQISKINFRVSLVWILSVVDMLIPIRNCNVLKKINNFERNKTIQRNSVFF